MVRDTEIAAVPPEIKELELSGETAFLVHCARLRLSPRRTQAIKDILGTGIDWDSLLKKANLQRLTPLVTYHLRSPDLAGLVPKSILVKLKGIYYQSLARNMLLQEELSRLLSALNNENIPVIILKGSALLDIIYQDISLRPMSDLDILVRPDDLDRAEALVLGMEYSYILESRNISTDLVKRHLPTMKHGKKYVFLEVHQHIVSTDDAAYFDISDFWARARPVRKANAQALVFSPEDSIIHLGIKFLSDRRYYSNAALSQLCDISETVKYYGGSLDWDLVVRVSREKGFTAGMHSVFYACQRVLGTPVPAGVVRQLRPPDFDPGVADLFLRRRVLDTRPWLAHELVDYKATYNRRRAFGAIIGRFSRLAAGFLGRDGHTGKRRLFSAARLKIVIPRVFGVILKPSELKEDLLLDRWLHDLYK
jgi:hypothetical protein